MNEDYNNNIPTPVTGDALLVKEVEPYLLSAAVDYPEPHYLLEYQGVGFSPLGGIQAISGQKKNGKTFVLTQLMSVILNASSERVKAKLPGLTLNESTLAYLDKQPSVLYVDTEMEKLNTAKVIRRVHWLCGWELNQDHDNFRTLWLRTVEEPAEKIRIVQKAIALYKPTAVFIDGIRDLVSDFNSLDETMPLIASLMKTATECDCCIWNVLHYNPRPANDDEGKMRGHLGTELGNKVTDTLASFKKKTPDGFVTFTVRQLDARGKDIPDWTFEILDDAGGLGIPRIIGQVGPSMTTDVSDDELTSMTYAIRKVITPPKSERYINIVDGIKKVAGIGTNKAQRWFRILRERGIITDPMNGLYSLDMKSLKILEDDLPF